MRVGYIAWEGVRKKIKTYTYKHAKKNTYNNKTQYTNCKILQ